MRTRTADRATISAIMRSLIAMLLAVLTVAAHGPALINVGSGRTPHKTGESMAPCCGTAACRMHTGGCQAHEGCSAAGVRSARAPSRAGKAAARLRVAPCGPERVVVTPGVPDPGTLEATHGPAAVLAAAGSITLAPAAPPSRASEPAEPPPRA